MAEMAVLAALQKDSKVLRLTFTLSGSEDDLQLTIDKPKADLTADAIKAAAAKMIPAIEGKAGADVAALKSAQYITVTANTIVGADNA